MIRQFSRRRFRDHRRALGLSLEQLASDLGKSVWTTIGYEHGRVVPPTNMLPLIAQRFGCTIDDLFNEVGQ